jgi:hypothetical protein
LQPKYQLPEDRSIHQLRKALRQVFPIIHIDALRYGPYDGDLYLRVAQSAHFTTHDLCDALEGVYPEARLNNFLTDVFGMVHISYDLKFPVEEQTNAA